MGMFDTFVNGNREEVGYDTEEYKIYETQVKMFYLPMYTRGFGIMHSGGLCNYFYLGDQLPIENNYYKYPKDFYLIEIGEIYEVIHIKDGRLFEFIGKVQSVKEFLPCFDFNGREFEFNSLDEIQNLKMYNSVEGLSSNIFKEKSLYYQLAEIVNCFEWSKLKDDEHMRRLYRDEDILEESVTLTNMIEDFRINYPEVFAEYCRNNDFRWGT